MSCLVKSEYIGTIAWLGRVTAPEDNIRSEALNTADATFDGIVGESHSGATRPSCVRVTMLHPKSTEIRNTRQLSILSAEENAEIAASMGLEHLDPSWLGASIVIAGLPDFTHIPPGSRLQTTAGTTLTVDLENTPCNWPAKEIETECPSHGKALDPKKARGESIGIEKISAVSGQLLFAELTRMMESEVHSQDYYEAAYQRLVHEGIPFHSTDITGLDWTEIDTVADFEAANAMFKTEVQTTLSD